MNRCIAISALAAALSGMCGTATAQTGAPRAPERWYAGLNIGASDANADSSIVAVSGATNTNFVTDQRDPGVTVFGGFRFNRYVALEGGYAWLGEFQATNQVFAPASGALNADFRVIGLFANAVGTLPITDRFGAFAKVGVLGSETRTFRSISGAVTPAPGIDTNAVVDEPNLTYGLGLQYRMTERTSVRGEWQRFVSVGDAKTGEFDINLYSVGLVFSF